MQLHPLHSYRFLGTLISDQRIYHAYSLHVQNISLRLYAQRHLPWEKSIDYAPHTYDELAFYFEIIQNESIQQSSTKVKRCYCSQ